MLLWHNKSSYRQPAAGENFQELHWFWQFLIVFPVYILPQNFIKSTEPAAGEKFQKLHCFWQFLSTFPAIWHNKISYKQPAAGENFQELQFFSTFSACWKKITLFLTTLGHVWGVGLIDSRLGSGADRFLDWGWGVGLLDWDW